MKIRKMDKEALDKQVIALIVVVLIIFFVAGSFILYNQWPKMTGKTLVLETRPVDPMDLFRGQYMAIGYEISQVNNTKGYISGEQIYVILQKDSEGIWRYSGDSRYNPGEGDYIRGKIREVRGDRVIVEYGIEQFFFEQNAKVPTQNITVAVQVASSGRAVVKELLQNGKPIKIEYEEFDIRK